MNNVIKENWEIIQEKIIKLMYEDGYFPLTLADEITKVLEQQLNNGWIPVSSGVLPEETKDYLCTVEWYGTSTKKLIIDNGYKIEKGL